MQKLKKPLSILLSLVMIFSVFTIIPMTASAADGDTVSVFARKWVQAEVVNGDYFRVSDLYDGFKICRVDPNGGFDSNNYDTTQTAVWNQTGDMSLSDPNRNNGNKLTIDSWGLTAAWGIDPGRQNDGCIYLSTHEDNSTNYNDGAQWWFYTWEIFSAIEHDAVSPTYDAATGEYRNGTATAYYTAGDRYFIADGNSYTQVSYDELFTVPYFEYEYLSDAQTIRLVKCNSNDADITVPDTVPAQFYPSEAPAGTACSIIKEEAFKNRTSLKNVIIGNNVNHLAKNAFYGCRYLETVTVGNNLDYVGYTCFYQCGALTDFTTTSTKRDNFSGVQTIANTNRSERSLIVHCYHDSGIARYLSQNAYTYGENSINYYVEFAYLDELEDEEPVEHNTYVDDWDWKSFDTRGKVTAYFECRVCQRTWALNATVEQVVDTPATCTAAGTGHYKATVTFDGETYEDDDDGDHTCTIPALNTIADKKIFKVGEPLVIPAGTPVGKYDSINQYTQTTYSTDTDYSVEYSDNNDGSLVRNGTTHAMGLRKDSSYAYIFTGLYITKQYNDGHYGIKPLYYKKATAPTWSEWQIGDETVEVTLSDFYDLEYGEAYADNYDYPQTFEATITSEVTDPATCIAAGNKRYTAALSVYDYTATDTKDEVITDANAHNLTHHPAVEPRLSTDGNSEYWDCSLCHKYFSDDHGENEIAENSWVLEKTAVAKYEQTYSISWYGSIHAAHEDVYQTQGRFVIDLLKDVEDDYTFPADFADYPFRVRKNGKNLTVVAPEGYNLHEYTTEAGVTVYSISHDEHSYTTEWNDENPVHHDNYWDVDVVFTCIYCDHTQTVKATARDTSVTTHTASCTEGGYKEAIFTANIGSTYSSKVIRWDETGPVHDPIHHDAVAPTYNKAINRMTAGNVEYWQCRLCHKYFTDEACTHEIESPTVNYFEITKNNEGEVKIDKYNGADTEVYIPDTVPYGCPNEELIGQNIETISAYSFKDNTNITKVTMGNNIAMIGWQAFMGCTNLKEVYVGSGIRCFSAQSFFDCTSITDFYCTKTDNFKDGPLFTQYTFNTSTGFTFHGAHSGAFYDEAHKSHINSFGKVFTYIGTDAHTYRVTFNWDGYTCTTATVTCEHCDIRDTVDNVSVTSAITTEPTEDTDGVRTYTASVEYNGDTLIGTKTEVIPKSKKIAGHSLTLDGDIGVNFYLNLSADELAQGVRIDFAWNGKTDFVTFNSDSTPEDKEGVAGLYKATCRVSAAEMNDEITATVTIGNASEPIATETYKVRDYADVIITNEDNKFTEDLITLVKTMLNYGASAQMQFNHNTDALANAGIGYDLAPLSNDEISDIDREIPDKESINARLANAGIEYYGYSLILKTETTLRFYFKKNGADTTKLYLLDTDDVNVGTVHDYNDLYCYIEITDIPAFRLDDLYELKYDDISLGGFSALSYVKDVLKNDNGAQLITDTVTALYRYNEAAVTYFNNIA